MLHYLVLRSFTKLGFSISRGSLSTLNRNSVKGGNWNHKANFLEALYWDFTPTQWVGVMYVLLLRRDIHGYKVPSTYTRRFHGLLYLHHWDTLLTPFPLSILICDLSFMVHETFILFWVIVSRIRLGWTSTHACSWFFFWCDNIITKCVVQFTSPCSLDRWIHYFFIDIGSL